ncbi:hypothetical protein G4G27_08345 [Sphingomonas sp. So64.6b]|uniref:hypothetical protein n=1 Tax=Sphingomonas sp. So64.6b TaxID=2997354 RepID=UPI001601CECE|nr:hypothetical protein [Sphingomonas sp. So64.6b]QNA83996.1 hypothetical protein G4G27_08345 [Sphingomonas sp. So64.6b]
MPLLSGGNDPSTASKSASDKRLTIAVLAICGLLIVTSIIFIALPMRDRAGNASPKAVGKAAPAPAVIAAPAAPTEQPAGPGARPAPREPDPPYSTPATLAVPKGNMADWFPPDSYPPDARRKEQEGRVTVGLAIDPKACRDGVGSYRAADRTRSTRRPVASRWRMANSCPHAMPVAGRSGRRSPFAR